MDVDKDTRGCLIAGAIALTFIFLMTWLFLAYLRG